jgi:hypothetical protein
LLARAEISTRALALIPGTARTRGTVRPQEAIAFARAAFQAGKTVLSWFVDEEVAEVDQSQIIERPRLQLIEVQGLKKGFSSEQA